jgi:hypothetical protein
LHPVWSQRYDIEARRGKRDDKTCLLIGDCGYLKETPLSTMTNFVVSVSDHLGFGKNLGEAMIADRRRAIGAARARQTACDALSQLRALDSPSCCKDKEDTIARERASVEKVLIEIVAELSPLPCDKAGRSL